MLVLTRKNGETICISREIEVTVLSISRNVVKLGFSAPPQVDIRRQELKSTSARIQNNKSLSTAAVYS
jgi:carbon storage regulator